VYTLQYSKAWKNNISLLWYHDLSYIYNNKHSIN
jgi:hypothetical protein